MKDSTGKTLCLFGLAVCIIGLIFCVILIIGDATSIEHRTLQGTITSSEVITKNGEIDYLVLTFNNNTVVKVKQSGLIHNTLDFTIHSKLIVSLSRHTFWFVATDYYIVDLIVKLPGD